MTDPLAQVVGLLKPDLSFAKLTEASGPWRIRRSEGGTPFFCAILDGTVQLEVHGRAPLHLARGGFLLIPAAFDFTFTSSTAPVPARGPDSVPIQVRPGVYRIGNPAAEAEVRMLVGYCTFGSADAALLVSLLPSLIHARGDARLTTLIQLAVDESRAERAGREVVLARLMEILFIEALRSAGSECSSGMLRGLGDDRVAVAIRHIHTEPNSAWTVEALAKSAALSRSAFYDRFRRAVGVTPMEYLLHWRMVLAKQLLANRQVGVAEVAQRVGYGSASSFSVAFTRHVGMPPGVYARQQRAA